MEIQFRQKQETFWMSEHALESQEGLFLTDLISEALWV